MAHGLRKSWRCRSFESPAFQCQESSGMGSTPTLPHAPISILMTRLPGRELGKVYETLSDEDKKTAFSELKTYLSAMRKWANTRGGNRICSISGTAIRSVRVPGHFAGPYENEREFNEYLIRA